MNTTVAGVDGCRGGWVVVSDTHGHVDACVVRDFSAVLDTLPSDAFVAIDIPIGLTDAGPRDADRDARRLLGRVRASSVFPAPARAALAATTYSDACARHEQADGRRMSHQAFNILAKVREVDAVMASNPALQARVREASPELSFATWNGGVPMQHRKTRPEGRNERAALIDAAWPGARARVWSVVRGLAAADDLHDAFATMWTARRVRDGVARAVPAVPVMDAHGLRMEIVA